MTLHLNKYGSGFPLVFFHGWGFDSQIWLSLVPDLIRTYQVIIVDLPGFGQTPVMDWALFKSELLAKVPEFFAVLGWSLGGLYATRLALEEPERVLYLMNISTSPRFIVHEDWPGIPETVFSEFRNKLTSDPLDTLNKFIGLQTNASEPSRHQGIPPSIAGLELGFSILGSWDFREELNNLKQAVCYIFGRLDRIVPIKTMEAMQEKHPHFHYVFFNKAAHMPFLSHKDLFIEEIRGFIP